MASLADRERPGLTHSQPERLCTPYQVAHGKDVTRKEKRPSPCLLVIPRGLCLKSRCCRSVERLHPVTLAVARWVSCQAVAHVREGIALRRHTEDMSHAPDVRDKTHYFNGPRGEDEQLRVAFRTPQYAASKVRKS